MDKTLGGKSGKLKCSQCGKPRYPKVDLCPACYFDSSRWKWYGLHGFWEVVIRSDGDTEVGGNALVKTRATSLDHALSKFDTRLQWIYPLEDYIESYSEHEVDEWLKKKKN